MNQKKYFYQLKKYIEKQDRKKIMLGFSLFPTLGGIIWYNQDNIRNLLNKETETITSNTLKSEQLKKELVNFLKDPEIEKQLSDLFVKASINAINDKKVTNALWSIFNPFKKN